MANATKCTLARMVEVMASNKTRKCSCCKRKFEQENPDQKMCPDCFAYSGPHYDLKKKRTKTKPKPKMLSFAEISHIGDVFYKIHNKYLHYGDIVNLINLNPNKCVCCGSKTYKNNPICCNCKKVGELKI